MPYPQTSAELVGTFVEAVAYGMLLHSPSPLSPLMRPERCICDDFPRMYAGSPQERRQWSICHLPSGHCYRTLRARDGSQLLDVMFCYMTSFFPAFGR